MHTVFIGGGTPSLFAPAAIERLIAAIRARLPLEPGCEITLEANPGTFERERFHGYARGRRDPPVDRGAELRRRQARRARPRPRRGAGAGGRRRGAGDAFATFNLDLMYALPGQSLADCERDVDTALSFAPPHLSIYHLTIEPNTFFARIPPPPADDDLAADDARPHRRARRRRAASSATRSRPSRGPAIARRHNLNYWEFGDYLGIGAGAHGKLTFPHRVVRQVRLRDPAAYMAGAEAGAAVASETRSGARRSAVRVHAQRAAPEGRLRAGALSRAHRPADVGDRAALAEAERRGLVRRDLQRVEPTALGFDFLNDLQQLFLPRRSVAASRPGVAPGAPVACIRRICPRLRGSSAASARDPAARLDRSSAPPQCPPSSTSTLDNLRSAQPRRRAPVAAAVGSRAAGSGALAQRPGCRR